MKKKKRYINEVSNISTLLRSKLNDEQKELLEKYDNAVCETSRMSEKYAFIKGVRFTTRIILEAMCDD